MTPNGFGVAFLGASTSDCKVAASDRAAVVANGRKSRQEANASRCACQGSAIDRVSRESDWRTGWRTR